MNRPKIINAIAILIGVLITQPVTAAEWLLLSRHGECAPLDALKKKLPSLPDLNSPDDLAAYLQARHVKYSRKVHSGNHTELHEFQVPSEGLSVILAPRQQCTEVLPGPR